MALINLGNIDNFLSDKLLRRQGIEPRAAGSVSKDANHFAALPPKPILLKLYVNQHPWFWIPNDSRILHFYSIKKYYDAKLSLHVSEHWKCVWDLEKHCTQTNIRSSLQNDTCVAQQGLEL